MPPIALISDIHGNLAALDAVLADVQRRLGPAAPIIVLGDLAFKGPQPGECVARVREVATAVIQGNTDHDLGHGVAADFVPQNERQRVLMECLHWTRERVDPEELQYLAGLPFAHEVRLGRFVLRCVHASPRDLEEAILPDGPAEKLASMFERTAALGADAADRVDAVAYGHIHVAWNRFLDGRLLLNPGSAGVPVDGWPLASYAVLEEDAGSLRVGHIRVPYDIDATVAAARERGLPDADNLERQLRTGVR